MDITLDKFKPRPYQLPLIDAFEYKKFKRLIAVWPRRAGKDIVAFNLMIRAAFRKKGVYFYIFPSYAQAKKVIWDSITNSGERFLDFIPPQLIYSSNSQEMKINLINGSIIQLVGSDNVDSLVGTNPQGIIFSEYALQDPRAYQFLRPILVANGGWSLMITTPRGKGSFYDLFKMAQKSPNWYVQKLTVEDTKHISKEDIDRERDEGLMSDDLIQQEYYTSFDMGVEGGYYTKYMEKVRDNNRITFVPYESAYPVHTFWDLGVRDSTTIIFAQFVGTSIRIIDCYEKSKEGLEHYVKVINNKDYLYGKHFAPHDIQVREFTSGMARIDKARQLGIKFIVAPNVSIMDGIEAVRSSLGKMYFDSEKTGPLVRALENYRQEYDSKLKIYKTVPLHDQFSHFADAMRYLCLCLPKTRDGLTPEELNKRFEEAQYGPSQSGLPSIFRNDLPKY